ncbi:MAG: hypothetical protein J5671_07905 [Bacteroidaceae bacterium]|nr:hypothetical protein [Bacteroidaceae bacterium]
MKRIALILFLLTFAVSREQSSLHAQRTPLEKYELAPGGFENVYIDHVKGFASHTIDIGDNQYLGQVSRDHQFYGYGMFINGDGSLIIGKFRDSQLLFGITLTQTGAVVGNQANHAAYSLTSGRLEYIIRNGEKLLPEQLSTLDYGFVTMKYSNGDQYVGEVYQRKRHGYGIYYYRNGDFWFGEYDGDIRNGFGAYFTVDGDIQIGEWQGEDEKRVIQVKKRR